jgi:hypothetical protein
MKKTKQIILLLLISLTLAACRYDEGPIISFRTVDNRVAQKFNLIEFTKDNVDMTQELKDSVGNKWSFLTYQQAGVHNLFVFLPYSTVPNPGDYHISSNKKNLEVVIKPYSSVQYNGIEPFKPYITTIWKIERLTMEEMWLSSTYNNADYYLKLVANEN